MRLDKFSNQHFDRGAPLVVEALWYFASSILVSSWVPGSSWRRILLRAFGARIGRGIVIKPRVRIKYPWRLTIGDNCWIGESVWLDNLAEVSIGDQVCISQGAYLCTGSHDWSRERFDLVVKPIRIGSHAWICAMSRIGPGVEVGSGAVLGFGLTATRHLEAWQVHGANGSRPRKVVDAVVAHEAAPG